MSKRLKKVTKYDDSYLKCCRYCKHYYNGYCERSGIRENENIIQFFEQGDFQEGIVELLNDRENNEDLFNFILESMNIKSEKKLKEFKNSMYEFYQSYIQDLAISIDGYFYRIVNQYVKDDLFGEKYRIYDPETFYCEKWE